MDREISHKTHDVVRQLFGREKVIIGVVHCHPLPGSPRYKERSIEKIYAAALRDAESYVSGGCHGLIIENHGDIPFLKPADIGHETTTALAVITDRIRKAFDVPLGINVLANAAIPALAVAKAGGARFVRVNQWANAYVANEGIVEGEAAKALRFRSAIGAEDVAVFADAHVKHGAHAIVADRPIAELVRDLEFFDADAVIATGQRTGDEPQYEEIDMIRASTRLPVLAGSGVTAANVAAILARTRGVIVASSLKFGGVWWNAVEETRVRAFMEAARPGLGE